jgi:glutamate synthase (NADPH/NADH) small chain
VTNALDWIADYKSGVLTKSPARVAVVGAGNTAIDAAIAAVRLGAEEVTMIYRRGPEQMSAFKFEYEHAKAEGVQFLFQVQPVGLKRSLLLHHVEGIELQALEASADGALVPVHGKTTVLPVDCVVLSIGQATHSDLVAGSVVMERGRILIDRATGQTSVPHLFAGGDCTNGGREVVDAVADGKRAGIAMAAWLATDAAKRTEAAHA